MQACINETKGERPYTGELQSTTPLRLVPLPHSCCLSDYLFYTGGRRRFPVTIDDFSPSRVLVHGASRANEVIMSSARF